MLHHFATFGNIVAMYKIDIFQRNISNISTSIEYLFVFKNISESKNCNVTMKYFAIFDAIVLQYFNCKEILEIFPTFFCNILCAMWFSYTSG